MGLPFSDRNSLPSGAVPNVSRWVRRNSAADGARVEGVVGGLRGCPAFGQVGFAEGVLGESFFAYRVAEAFVQTVRLAGSGSCVAACRPGEEFRPARREGVASHARTGLLELD